MDDGSITKEPFNAWVKIREIPFHSVYYDEDEECFHCSFILYCMSPDEAWDYGWGDTPEQAIEHAYNKLNIGD